MEKKKHDSTFRKLLEIANPQLGEEWLEEILRNTGTIVRFPNCNWRNCTNWCCHMSMIIRKWSVQNYGIQVPLGKGFPTGSVSDKDLEQFFHKATYWHYVHHYTLTFHPLLRDFHNLITSICLYFQLVAHASKELKDMQQHYLESQIPHDVLAFEEYVDKCQKPFWRHGSFGIFSVNVPTTIHRAN